MPLVGHNGVLPHFFLGVLRDTKSSIFILLLLKSCFSYVLSLLIKRIAEAAQLDRKKFHPAAPHTGLLDVICLCSYNGCIWWDVMALFPNHLLEFHETQKFY